MSGSDEDLFGDETIGDDSPESDSSDDVVNKKKTGARRVIVSDDEEEDEQEVKALMSPRTRRSIGFTRPTEHDDFDESDDETDDETDDDDQDADNDSQNNDVSNGHHDSTADTDSSHGHEETTADLNSSHEHHSERAESELYTSEEKFLYSPSTRKSIGGNFRPTSTEPSSDFDSSQMVKTIVNEQEFVPEVLDLTKDSDGSPVHPPVPPSRRTDFVRRSNFDQSILQKMSSTVIPQDGGSLVETSDSVIEIPDSPQAPSARPKVQPTLTRMTQPKKVSRSFYECESRKLEDIKNQIKTIEKLSQLAPDLPDKGASLKKSLKDLISKLGNQAEILNGLEIDETQSLKRSLQNSIEDDVVVIEGPKPPVLVVDDDELNAVGGTAVVVPSGINWEDIKNANALVKPKFTGERGLKTFGDNKMRVEKGLNQIHGSLATQPTENDLADTPTALNVELMEHQRSALSWMQWREKSRPRGGILADDMGLGKTLSMIALILAKYDEDVNESKDAADEDEDEDSDDDGGWMGKRRDERYTGGTLVVCPASLVGQWEGEISKRVRNGALSFNLHHGARREVKAKRLARYDVVCTTYAVASSEHASGGPLFRVKWNRVILDEAHMIRNHKAKMSVACSELNARYRWALTGTPICNKEIDVFALLRFLRFVPFNDLHMYKQFLEDKKGGGGPRLHAIIKTLMLRRTKQMLEEKKQLELPSREWKLIQVEFSTQEKLVYRKVLAYSKQLFTQYLAQNHKGNHGHGAERFDRVHAKFQAAHGQTVQVHQILLLLMRLRQLCCHPGLINAMLEDEDLDVSKSEFDNSNLLERLSRLNLDDDDALDASNDDEDGARASQALLNKANPIFDFDRPSSKIKVVIEHFKTHVQGSPDKAIFVSQWTSYLALYRTELEKLGVKYCEINGTVPVKDRGGIVASFNAENRGPKVMLLALTAGGVGLNLIGANHLYILDLHWNPQLERQAQDRIYRVGQRKGCHIYKFMMASAIEERILELQQKKLDLANSVLTGAKNIGSKLTMDDLKSLFELNPKPIEQKRM